jgi:hypothetical protein
MPPSTRATAAAGLAFLAPLVNQVVGDSAGDVPGALAAGLLLAIAVWAAAMLPAR